MNSFGSPRAAVLAVLVVLMPLLALVPKYLLIARAFQARPNIETIGFGFGDYVHNLRVSSDFRTCATPSFITCQPDRCQYATRMPVIPLLYAGLAEIVGEDAGSIAFAKCLVTACLLAGLLAILVRDLTLSTAGVILLYALYFGPQALKHGASIEYEEGLLLDLELALAVAVSYLLSSGGPGSGLRTTLMGAIAVTIGVVMYFTKTTALLSLGVVMAIFLCNSQVLAWVKPVVFAFAVMPFVAWGAHTYATSGSVHLSSSWNGENLFRGYNSESLAIYPQVSLDRIFDSRRAVLRDGTSIALGDYSSRACFSDEWAWSRFYADKAAAWLRSHPVDAALFSLEKFWVTFVEVRHTPYQVSATEPEPGYPPVVEATSVAWMVLARVSLLALIVRLVIDFAIGSRGEALWTFGLIGAAFAPYVGVFAYQRHIVPVLVMSGALLVFRGMFGMRGSEAHAPAVHPGALA